MSAGYHLLQFVPDPFGGTAVTIGALVQAGSEWRFQAAEGDELLLPRSLPPAATTLFRSILSELKELTGPRLPISLGPHVRLGPPLQVPRGVEHPVAWVTQSVLAAPPGEKQTRQRRKKASRGAAGKLFLREHHLDRYVGTRFRAQELGERHPVLKPITHYVRGPRVTMLLEPLVLDSDTFENELQEVSGTLLAWESATRRLRQANLTFSVYAIGNSRDHLHLLQRSLADMGVDVFDTKVSADRQRFMATVKALADAGALQPH